MFRRFVSGLLKSIFVFASSSAFLNATVAVQDKQGDKGGPKLDFASPRPLTRST